MPDKIMQGYIAKNGRMVKIGSQSDGSGTSDYNSLTNKPLINGVELYGNKTNKDLNIIIPTKLPNPNSITFTGGATGSYDGSSAVTIDIPQGGTGGPLQPLTFTGAVSAEYDGTQPVSVEIPAGGGIKHISYNHSSNIEIRPTNLDLQTGIFVLANHGIADGQRCVVVPEAHWACLPYELWTTKMASLNSLQVKVLSADTFQLSYGNKPLTYQNPINTAVDLSKWHIELSDFTTITIDTVSKNIAIRASGYIGCTTNYPPSIRPVDANGNPIPQAFGGYDLMKIGKLENLGCIPLFVDMQAELDATSVVVRYLWLYTKPDENAYKYMINYPGLIEFGDQRTSNGYKDAAMPLNWKADNNRIAIMSSNNKNQVPLIPVNGFRIEVTDYGN